MISSNGALGSNSLEADLWDWHISCHMQSLRIRLCRKAGDKAWVYRCAVPRVFRDQDYAKSLALYYSLTLTTYRVYINNYAGFTDRRRSIIWSKMV